MINKALFDAESDASKMKKLHMVKTIEFDESDKK